MSTYTSERTKDYRGQGEGVHNGRRVLLGQLTEDGGVRCTFTDHHTTGIVRWAEVTMDPAEVRASLLWAVNYSVVAICGGQFASLSMAREAAATIDRSLDKLAGSDPAWRWVVVEAAVKATRINYTAEALAAALAEARTANEGDECMHRPDGFPVRWL